MLCGAFPGMLWDLLNVVFLVAKCSGTGIVTCRKNVMFFAAGQKCYESEIDKVVYLLRKSQNNVRKYYGGPKLL